MAVSIHDVLRALVRQESRFLNDPRWQAEAEAAVDAHEQASAELAPDTSGHGQGEASAEVPEPAAQVPFGSGYAPTY